MSQGPHSTSISRSPRASQGVHLHLKGSNSVPRGSQGSNLCGSIGIPWNTFEPLGTLADPLYIFIFLQISPNFDKCKGLLVFFKGTLTSETKTSPFMYFGSLIKNLKEFLESVQPFWQNPHFCKILRACFGGFTKVSFSESLGSTGVSWGPQASHWGPQWSHLTP